jgi:trehalose 6-phosphate phosphatase
MNGDAPSLPEPDPNWAVLLDIDGTMIDIAPTPADAVAPPELRATLAALYRALNGAVALISGRSLASIDALFDPLRLPAAGQHGAEIRPAPGEPPTGEAGEPFAHLKPAIEAFAAVRPGLIIEFKGMAIAAHYRLAPQYRDELRRFLADCIAGETAPIEILEGRAVFEVKLRTTSKRTAVLELMRAPAFAGRIPVFIGDDTTDEDGFAGVIALKGYPIKVGPGESLAARRIADPTAVRAWLKDIVRRLAQEREHEIWAG